MKAIEELGVSKAIRFCLFVFLQFVYNILYLPPLRSFFLTLLGATVGKNTIIMNVKFFNWHHKGPNGLKIGKDCFIGDETLVDLYEPVILEDRVTIAQRVIVLTHLNVGYHDHPLQKYFPKTSKKVVFKKGSVIGAGAIILPGVSVGEKSFIAAGSVVTKNIPSMCLVGGVPAKLIRKIRE